MSACVSYSAATILLCVLCVLSVRLYTQSIQSRVLISRALCQSIRLQNQRFVINDDRTEMNQRTNIEEKGAELESPPFEEMETVAPSVTVQSIVSTIPPTPSFTPTMPLYRLVLFTTEDGDMKNGNRNVLHMFKLFQENFNFKAFVFTNTSAILEECARYGIDTLSYVDRNPYGLPYIGSMFTVVRSVANATYYGYINADILVSDKIFDLLSRVDVQRSQLRKSPFVEICHNAYNYETPLFKPSFSLSDYSQLLQRVAAAGKNQRGPSSIDMFILSREFAPYKFDPYVIARSRIDTYMLYYCFKHRCVMFDSGNAGTSRTSPPLERPRFTKE